MTSSRGSQLLESYCLLFNDLNSSSLHVLAQSCPTLCDPMNCSPPGSSVHGDSPGKNTGVGCRFLLQGSFPTQGSNPYVSLMSPALASRFFTTSATWEITHKRFHIKRTKGKQRFYDHTNYSALSRELTQPTYKVTSHFSSNRLFALRKERWLKNTAIKMLNYTVLSSGPALV